MRITTKREAGNAASRTLQRSGDDINEIQTPTPNALSFPIHSLVSLARMERIFRISYFTESLSKMTDKRKES